MKQALNTLFITTPGTWLSLRNNNVVVKIDGVEKNAVNIGILESILCFGQVNATFPLMGYCAEHGVNFAFFGENGKFLGRVQGPVHGNVLLRRGQYRIADDDAQAASIVRCVLLGKLANTKAALRRFMRDHLPVSTPALFALDVLPGLAIVVLSSTIVGACMGALGVPAGEAIDCTLRMLALDIALACIGSLDVAEQPSKRMRLSCESATAITAIVIAVISALMADGDVLFAFWIGAAVAAAMAAVQLR